MQTAPTRARLDDLKARIAKTTTATVLANPNQLRDTALLTASLLGEVLDLIDQLAPYADETPPGGN